MSSQRQRNWDRDQDQVHQIPDLIPINKEDHATPPPVFPIVSDYEPDDDYIVDPQLPEGEPLSHDGPPDSPIPPELLPHQS